jgi:2-polyprenyl-6-methoxyphenol hydroxylase-like FAD-dependent oxidoreductase
MRHLYPALRTFVQDKVDLVDEAAHAITPNLGQGACTAILDAEALTRAVAQYGAADLPSALRAYDAERRRSAQRVAFGSRSLHRFMRTERIWLRNARRHRNKAWTARAVTAAHVRIGEVPR